MQIKEALTKPFVKGVQLFRLRGISALKKRDLVLLIIPTLLVATVITYPRDNVFSIHANTNVIALELQQSPLNQWDISSAKLITDPFEPGHYVLDEIDSYIIFNDGVKANIMTLDSALHVTLEHEKSIGNIDSSSLKKTLGTYAELTIPVSDDRIFPFNATMVLGEHVSVGVNSILHDAQITIVEEKLFRHGRYLSGEHRLEMGDKVSFYSNRDSMIKPAGKGFFKASSDDPIVVVSHTPASIARVDRLGSTGYDIKPSVWSRLMHDPVIAAITTLIATIFLSLEFIVIVRKLLTGKE